MKVHVKFGSIFQAIFGEKEKDVDLEEGADISMLLGILCDTPERRAKIFDPAGKSVRPYVSITKNGRFILEMKWLQTELSHGDRVEIILLAAGG